MTDESTPSPAPEFLLSHVDWVRRLAGSLVQDSASADDISQEALTAALAAPPRHQTNVRSWLGTIVRRTAGRRRRSEQRRAHRELQSAPSTREPRAEDSYERVSLQRDIAQLVLELDEPYRRAITLRYFEELPPQAIADATGTSVHTVKTHLQRGLEQLRQRLDAEHGTRAAWVAPLLPLVDGTTASGLVLGSSPLSASAAGLRLSTAGLLLMKLTLTVTAAAVVFAVAIWLWPTAPEPAPTGAEPRAESANPDGADARRSQAEVGEAQPAQRAAVRQPTAMNKDQARPAPPNPRRARHLRGQVLGVDGRPLPDIHVRQRGKMAVSWQGGDIGWIANANRAVRILPAQEERLRSDSAAAESFFAQFEHPQEWRATVLGTLIPEREQVTGIDGRFEFESAAASDPVDVVEPGYATLASGTARANNERVWIASRIARVTGRVLDDAGEPIAGATVLFDWSDQAAWTNPPKNLRIQQRLRAPEAKTGSDGRYVLRKVPVVPGARIIAKLPGRDPVRRAAPDRETTGFDLVFGSALPNAECRIQGRVLDDAGQPVAEATVCFFSKYTKTDSAGGFEIAVVEPPPRAAVTAYKAGYRPIQLDGFGARVTRDPNLGRGMTLTLPGRSLELEGLVLAPDGKPLRGACINVVDDTVLDFSMTNLETRSGGRKRFVQTGADGRFRLTGLDDRTYRLRVWHPTKRLATITQPVHPLGSTTVRFSKDEQFEEVQGRVINSNGDPVPGSSVQLSLHYHVTKSGAGTMHMTTPPVTTDATGMFRFTRVPTKGAVLVVRSPAGGAATTVPVERIGSNQRVLVQLDGPAHVRVLTSRQKPIDAVQALGADGKPLPIRRIGTVVDADTPVQLTVEPGSFPLFTVSPSARYAVGLRNGTPVIRVPLELAPGSHCYARLTPR